MLHDVEGDLKWYKKGSSGLSVLSTIALLYSLEAEVESRKALLGRLYYSKYFLYLPSLPLKKGREKRM
jgi:hypothetical protein